MFGKAEMDALLKIDDRSFVNPFLNDPMPQNPFSGEFRKSLLECIEELMSVWEIDIREDINSTIWTDISVYTGISGYSLLYLDAGVLLENETYIEQAYFLAEKCCMHLKKKRLSFLTGDAGPLAISAVCSHRLNQPEKRHHFITRLEKAYKLSLLEDCSLPDEILYGRAGCLYSLLFIRKYAEDQSNKHLISSIAKAIVQSGKRFSDQCKSEGNAAPPLMYKWHEKKYLGAAHGMAGIIYILLQAKDYLEEGTLQNEIFPTLDFMLSTRFPGGNLPSSLGNGGDRLVQWCHGSPGFVLCLLTAAQVFQSDAYLAEAKQCAEVIWERGILTKGFGLCHGIAGNAYAFLQLYQMTNDPRDLHRACCFARVIIDAPRHEFRTPDHPLSLFEGLAGTIHFLIGLLQPERSCFPGFQLSSLSIPM